MKKVYLLIVLIFGFQGCVPPASNVQPTALEQNPLGCIEQEALSDQLRNDRTNGLIYFGEGIAPLDDNDIGEAKENAKQRALAELSSSISVVIKADILDVLTGRSGGKISGEDWETAFKQKIRTYTRAVLDNVVASKPYIDCPRIGSLTYYVWVGKEIYEQGVKNDLVTKKRIVLTRANDGLLEWRNQNFATAYRSIAEALQFHEEFFGGLPLITRFADSKDSVDIKFHLEKQLVNFFQGVQLELLNEDLIYDASGRLNQSPIVYAFYGENNQKYPVPGLPLEVTFIEGSGKVVEEVSTKIPRGEVGLTISRVNPSTKTATLLVKIKDYGISQKDNLSGLRITLHRKPVIALAIHFAGAQNKSIQQRLTAELTGKLLQRNVDVIQLSDLPQERILSEAKDQNADALLSLAMISTEPLSVPPFDNLFEVSLRGSHEIRTIPSGLLAFSGQFTLVKGYGSSSGTAQNDALSKILLQLDPLLSQTTQAIK